LHNIKKNYENDPFHIEPSDVYGNQTHEELQATFQKYYKAEKEKKEKEEREKEERKRDSGRDNYRDNRDNYSRRSYRKEYRPNDNYKKEHALEINKDRKLVDYSDIVSDFEKPKDNQMDIDYEKSLHEFIPKKVN